MTAFLEGRDARARTERNSATKELFVVMDRDGVAYCEDGSGQKEWNEDGSFRSGWETNFDLFETRRKAVEVGRRILGPGEFMVMTLAEAVAFNDETLREKFDETCEGAGDDD